MLCLDTLRPLKELSVEGLNTQLLMPESETMKQQSLLTQYNIKLTIEGGKLSVNSAQWSMAPIKLHPAERKLPG